MWQTSPDPPARFWFICQSCLQPFPVYLLTWRTEGWALTLAGPAARRRPCPPPSPHARGPRRGRAGCLHDQRCARKQTPFLAQLQSPAKLTSNGKMQIPREDATKTAHRAPAATLRGWEAHALRVGVTLMRRPRKRHLLKQEGTQRPTHAQISHVPATRPEETCVRASKACVRMFVVVLTAKIWRRSHTHQLGMDKWQFVHTKESHVAVRANVNSTRHTEGRPASESTRHAD